MININIVNFDEEEKGESIYQYIFEEIRYSIIEGNKIEIDRKLDWEDLQDINEFFANNDYTYYLEFLEENIDGTCLYILIDDDEKENN